LGQERAPNDNKKGNLDKERSGGCYLGRWGRKDFGWKETDAIEKTRWGEIKAKEKAWERGRMVGGPFYLKEKIGRNPRTGGMEMDDMTCVTNWGMYAQPHRRDREKGEYSRQGREKKGYYSVLKHANSN